jgi:signal transduction histidine kinase
MRSSNSVLAQSADRMNTLINELLKFSRIGNSEVVEKVNCANVLNEVIADFDQLIGDTYRY